MVRVGFPSDLFRSVHGIGAKPSHNHLVEAVLYEVEVFYYVPCRLLYQPDEIFGAVNTDLVVRFAPVFTSLNKGLVHVWYL